MMPVRMDELLLEKMRRAAVRGVVDYLLQTPMPERLPDPRAQFFTGEDPASVEPLIPHQEHQGRPFRTVTASNVAITVSVTIGPLDGPVPRSVEKLLEEEAADFTRYLNDSVVSQITGVKQAPVPGGREAPEPRHRIRVETV